MVYSIRRIHPTSVVLPGAALAFLAGCLTVLALLATSAMAPAPIASSTLRGPIQLTFVGMPPALVLVAWPLLAAASGAAVAAACAWIYNLIVRFTGPVRVELDN
jgi:hypothetical protein